MKIETDNALQNFEVLKALVERKQKLEQSGDEISVENLEEIIEQFKYASAYQVLVEDK